ncbi:hypothetical protein V8E36_000078 [Tilletia maclaganii]
MRSLRNAEHLCRRKRCAAMGYKDKLISLLLLLLVPFLHIRRTLPFLHTQHLTSMSKQTPAQGLKTSGLDHGSEDLTANTSTTLGGNLSSGAGDRAGDVTTAQELGLTRGNDGSLGSTLADPKGGDHQPVHAHDVSLPPNAAHLAPQSNEQSRKPPYLSGEGHHH